MQFNHINYVVIWDIPRELWEYIRRDMLGFEIIPGETSFALTGEWLEKVRRYDLNDMPQDLFSIYLKMPTSLYTIEHYILTVEKSDDL